MYDDSSWKLGNLGLMLSSVEIFTKEERDQPYFMMQRYKEELAIAPNSPHSTFSKLSLIRKLVVRDHE